MFTEKEYGTRISRLPNCCNMRPTFFQRKDLGVFVHHNTLHTFQHLSFEQAVIEVSEVYGAEPYMSEEAFRAELGRGRIRRKDLEAGLSTEPDAELDKGRLTRR